MHENNTLKIFISGLIVFFIIVFTQTLLAYKSQNVKDMEELNKLNKINKEKFTQAEAILLMFKQNHCYTKDINVNKLGIPTLKTKSGNIIRGHNAFPNIKQKEPIKKFNQPVYYFCALGLSNFQTPYFFPSQNFYTLDNENDFRRQVEESITTARETQVLEIKWY